MAASSPASSLSATGGRSFRPLGVPSPSPSPRLGRSNTPSPASSNARRSTSSGRYFPLSRAENDLLAGEVSSELIDVNYTVHIPPTPD
eukprot:c36489_g1_i1 orf=1-261(-)